MEDIDFSGLLAQYSNKGRNGFNPIMMYTTVVYAAMQGNKHVKSVLVECARSAIRNKKSYFYSRYQRIAARRGGNRALIAVAHSMLTAIYHVLKDLQPYKELGCDYYSTYNREKSIQRNIRSLERMGVTVVIK